MWEMLTNNSRISAKVNGFAVHDDAVINDYAEAASLFDLSMRVGGAEPLDNKVVQARVQLRMQDSDVGEAVFQIAIDRHCHATQIDVMYRVTDTAAMVLFKPKPTAPLRCASGELPREEVPGAKPGADKCVAVSCRSARACHEDEVCTARTVGETRAGA